MSDIELAFFQIPQAFNKNKQCHWLHSQQTLLWKYC